MLYINFLCAGMSTLGLYPEDIEPENSYSHWPSRKRMQHIYKKFLKEGNDDKRFLRCPDL